MLKSLSEITEEDKNKKLIVFDLDGTLVETKSSLDLEMARLLGQLLEQKQVAVISGTKYEIFRENFVDKLKCSKELFRNLFLFPVTAASFYRHNGEWEKVYSEELSEKEKLEIKNAFKNAFEEIGYKEPEKVYGEIIEDRGAQITFSALGQDVVKVLGKEGVGLKKKWRDENQELKLKLVEALQKYLPNLEVRAAGYTSIDVTRKGIDKEYGIRQIKKHLGIPFSEMLFVGDALFKGGNDYPVFGIGVDCIGVNGPEDVKKIIKFLIHSH